MRTQFSKFALAAILWFALAFTLSACPERHDGGTETCGGKEYNTSEFSCVGGELVGKCKGVNYYPDYQTCVDGKIEDKNPSGGSSSGSGKSSSGGNTFVGEKGTFKDSRDDQTYKWVKIGEQTWMAQNLNYFDPWVGKCYNSKDENCEKYGRLYEWDGAIRLCPDGWHLPTEAEWEALISAVGDDAGKKLKSKSSDWGDGVGTDAYGFGTLPGGRLEGEFKNLYEAGFWWSSSAHRVDIGAGNGISGAWPGKKYQYSVRCVED